VPVMVQDRGGSLATRSACPRNGGNAGCPATARAAVRSWWAPIGGADDAQPVAAARNSTMTEPMDNDGDEPAPLQVDLAEPRSREALAEAVRAVRDAAQRRISQIERHEAGRVQQQRAEAEAEQARLLAAEEAQRRQQARAKGEQEREDERERLRQWRSLLPGGDA
jgi:hypothetical protein